MRGMMGRGKDWCLGASLYFLPFPSSPARFLFLSPQPPEGTKKENALIQKEHTCSSISTIRLNSKLLGAGILRARRGSLLSPLHVLLERSVK